MSAALEAKLDKVLVQVNEVGEVLKAVAKPKHDAERMMGTPGNPRTDVTAGISGPLGRVSKGFSLSRALAARLGFLGTDYAKEDLHALDLFSKSLSETNTAYGGLASDQHSIKLPLSTKLLPPPVHEHDGFRVFKAMEAEGHRRADPDETRWVLRKADLSYNLETLGGELVAPPQMGEFIELMRPNEALLSAGATVVPLPPNGRIAYPRQTGATSAYWVGENTSITQSNPTFGQVALQAKKLGDFVVLPNELLKYAAPAVDGIIRTDIAKTLALAFDYSCLYGSGSAAQPKGLTLYTGTNEVIDYAGLTPAPKGIGGNGNTLRPEDGYRMIGLVEDRNFQFEGWIMRPTMANNIQGYRADAAAPDDAAGGFVNQLMRAISDRLPGDNYCGYKTTKSAIVKNTNSKGSASNLTEVFGGQWSHWLLGMYGAVEVATSTQAGSVFQQDQTALRALLHCDAAPRYEGAFCWFKALLNTMK